MRLLLTTVRKDLRLLLRDPFALLLWFAIPVIILTLMHITFGGRSSSAPRPRGAIFVADNDGSFLSGIVASAFSQGPLGELFSTEKIPEADGRARMNKGEGSALVILPKGLQDALLRNSPAVIRLVTNPSQQILPAIASESLTMLSEAVHYLHLVAGDQLREIPTPTTAPSEAEILAASSAIYKLRSQIGPFIDPLLLDVEIRQQAPKTERKPFNFAAAIFPGMLLMTILFLTRASSDALWEELARGTLRRWQAAAAPLSLFLLARLAASVLTATVLSAIGLGAARLALDVSVANWPAALSLAAACAGVWYLVMLNLQILAGAQNGGEILTSFVLFPSLMMGGGMFPFLMMPPSFAAFGKVTPFGWMTVRLDAVLGGQATAAQVMAWLGILIAAVLLLFLFSEWHLRRKFLRG